MINPRAEESFRDGKQRLDSGRARDAAAFFKAAIDIERDEVGRAERQGRYLSYYGLALCRSRSGFREALRHCRTATSLEPDRADLWWNLGHVAMAVGRRAEAHRAWRRGLSLEPQHSALLAEVKRMGVRRAPVLGFLPRQHGLNVALGRLRSRLRAPVNPRSVATRDAAGNRVVATHRMDSDDGSITGIQVIG